jgi:hypothetical protein
MGLTPPSNFSPVALNVRVLPTNDVNASIRAEFDSKKRELRQISAQGSHSWTGRVQTSAGWSKRAFVEGVPGFDDPAFLNHAINAMTNVHTLDNRFGGVYSFSYDVLRSSLLQQTISAFYNVQCCGIAFEYQTYNYNGLSISPVASDRRFFLSFTLAGLGNFSPFNGAMSGVPR